MRLGIFGGTFDPPHIAHLILASEAYHQLALDRLLWVLTPNPPHKTNQVITPVEYRIAMLQGAISSESTFLFSSVDIDREPPHYAVDTVRLLRDSHPGAELIYLMGGDSLDDIPTWHSPQEFIQSCDRIGVLLRPGRNVKLAELSQLFPGLDKKLHFIRAPLLDISSSEIRKRIANQSPYRYYLPEKVFLLIEKHQLYK